MDEEALKEKLRKIEALFARAGTTGERQAANEAMKRILARLEEMVEKDPPVEHRFSLADEWSRRLFAALLRRYGLRPYRYSRQRRTTVMVRVSRGFVEQTLWPEFIQLSNELKHFLSEVTARVISQTIHKDTSEASVMEEPRQLLSGDKEEAALDPLPRRTDDENNASAAENREAKPQAHASKKRRKHRKRRRRA